MRKLTLDVVKERIFKINPNIKILSDVYLNAKSILKCECLIDGHIWDATYDNLYQGKGCPICGFKATGQKKSTSIEEIKNKLKNINPNILILGDLKKEVGKTNKRIRRYVHCKCVIDNCEWDADINHLLSNVGCPKCGGTMKLTLTEIKDRLKIINPNIEILSDTYIDARNKLKCVCLIDGYEWEANWSDLSQGKGCYKCSINSRCGDKCRLWKGGITPLSFHLRSVISQWKKDSFKKYNYKCDITGSNENIIIHHLFGFDKILKETMNTLNLPVYKEINKYTSKELKSIENKCLELHYKYGLGVCLCEELHKEFHKIYGKGNNTKEQYEEFKKMKLKQLNNNIA